MQKTSHCTLEELKFDNEIDPDSYISFSLHLRGIEILWPQHNLPPVARFSLHLRGIEMRLQQIQ